MFMGSPGRRYRGRGEGDSVKAFGELAAQVDAISRAEREADSEARRAERAEMDALDASVRGLDEVADLLARAALLAAGYRQHKRGEWRQKRGATA